MHRSQQLFSDFQLVARPDDLELDLHLSSALSLPKLLGLRLFEAARQLGLAWFITLRCFDTEATIDTSGI